MSEKFYPYLGPEYDPVRDVIEDDKYGVVDVNPGQEFHKEDFEGIKVLDDYYLSFNDSADYLVSVGDVNNPLILQLEEQYYGNAILVTIEDDIKPRKDVIVRFNGHNKDEEMIPQIATKLALDRIFEVDSEETNKSEVV